MVVSSTGGSSCFFHVGLVCYCEVSIDWYWLLGIINGLLSCFWFPFAFPIDRLLPFMLHFPLALAMKVLSKIFHLLYWGKIFRALNTTSQMTFRCFALLRDVCVDSPSTQSCFPKCIALWQQSVIVGIKTVLIARWLLLFSSCSAKGVVVLTGSCNVDLPVFCKNKNEVVCCPNYLQCFWFFGSVPFLDIF